MVADQTPTDHSPILQACMLMHPMAHGTHAAMRARRSAAMRSCSCFLRSSSCRFWSWLDCLDCSMLRGLRPNEMRSLRATNALELRKEGMRQQGRHHARGDRACVACSLVGLINAERNLAPRVLHSNSGPIAIAMTCHFGRPDLSTVVLSIGHGSRSD